VGPPQSLLKWGSFFNCCAYLAFGDVFRCAPCPPTSPGFTTASFGLRLTHHFIPS